jgi:PEP-CTERM motif-containing protein
MRQSTFPLSTCLFLAAAAILLPVSSVQASIISVYSNFSEDPAAGVGSYPYACSDPQCDNVTASEVRWLDKDPFGGNGTHPSGLAIATSFTVTGTQDLYLSEVQVAMYKFPDGSLVSGPNTSIGTNNNNLTIEIVSDHGGLPSDNVLEVLSVDPSIAEDGDTFLNLFSTSYPLLQAGATYWIEAKPTTSDTTDTSQDTFYGWIQSTSGAEDRYTSDNWQFTNNGGTGGWSGYFNELPTASWPAPTLNVFATTSLQADTPEPATMMLAGIALGGLLIWRKRARS